MQRPEHNLRAKLPIIGERDRAPLLANSDALRTGFFMPKQHMYSGARQITASRLAFFVKEETRPISERFRKIMRD